jgi:ABC-type transport system substrate-binding protein
MTRRDLIKTGALAAGAAAVLPARPAAAQLKTVARNRTLSLVWIGSREGRWVDFELWNPYSIGSNHQNGPGILYEPLAYYSAFADKEYLWLAESYRYSPDFKELTIKTRSGIKWSDGAPFSAEDVAYTLTSLRDLGPKVRWGVDVQQFMQEAHAADANTVVIKFKVPAPRFFFFLTYKYDIGVYIVPKHVFQGQDWTTFKHFDIAKGWPVTTGPWQVAFSSPQQKVIDRRDEWWAAKAGLAPLPKVERNIWLPNATEQQNAQLLISNQIDYAGSMQPATFQTIFRQNPKIITHSGQKPPYGYMDWWPISLYVNNERSPFDDKDVRWALSYFIDRQQVVDVGYLGASLVSPLPVRPRGPRLRPRGVPRPSGGDGGRSHAAGRPRARDGRDRDAGPPRGHAGRGGLPDRAPSEQHRGPVSPARDRVPEPRGPRGARQHGAALSRPPRAVPDHAGDAHRAPQLVRGVQGHDGSGGPRVCARARPRGHRAPVRLVPARPGPCGGARPVPVRDAELPEPR